MSNKPNCVLLFEENIKRLDNLERLKTESKEPEISCRDLERSFYKDRLLRLTIIILGQKQKCFMNDVYEGIFKMFSVASQADNVRLKLYKLCAYNIIQIHRLKLSKDSEMKSRYKEIKTKCPISRINYYEFLLNERNMSLWNYAYRLEFPKKI